MADRISENTGVSSDIILAQLGLETGWGKHVIPGTNNLGNVKDFSGNGVKATDNQTGSTDGYRAFDSLDAFGDHFSGLLNRKYKGAIGAGDDMDKYSSAMVAGGYAEDKSYASKLKSAYATVKQLIGNGKPKPEYGNLDEYGTADATRNGLPDLPKNDSGIVGDTAKTIAAGAVSGVQTLFDLGYAFTGVGGLDKVSKGLGEANDSINKSMSPEMQAAKDKTFFGDDENTAWTDPRAYWYNIFNGVGSMVPMIPLGMGAGKVAQIAMGAAKMTPAIEAAAQAGMKASAEAAASGMAKETALAIGKSEGQKVFESTLAKAGIPKMAVDDAIKKIGTANTIGFTTAGTAMTAGDAANGAMQEIDGMTHEQLLKSPEYVSRLQSGMDPAEAKEDIKRAAGREAGALGAAYALPLNAIIGHITGKLFTKGDMGAKTRLGNFGLAAAGEVPAESAEEGTTQYASNQGVKDNANPDKDLMNGVADMAFKGGLGAAGMAAPHAIRTPHAQEKPAPAPNSPLSNAALAGTPQAAPGAPVDPLAPGATPAQGQPDAFSQRMTAVQTRLEDPTLLSTIRNTEGLGPDSVNELLGAWGIARNPSIDPAMRERAMQGIEGAFHTFDNRPDFTLSKDKPQPVSGLLGHEPGTDVGPTDGGGGSAQGPSQGGPVDFPGNVYEGESSRVTDAAELPRQALGDIAAAPAVNQSAIAQRHAAIRHMVGQGYTGIEKEDNAYTLTHPKTGQTYPLLSPADTLIARAAIKKQIDEAAHGAASSPNNDLALPTQAQIDAENYKKGHLNIHGLDIAVENPQGSTRSGVSPEGKAWESKLNHHYGYIKRTEGADGDPVDVFLGNRPDSNQVFMVDQVNPATGEFDEHKVMLGFTDEASARAGYLANYEPGWKGLGAITAMSMQDFKGWLKEGDTSKQVAETTPKEDDGMASSGEKLKTVSGRIITVPKIDATNNRKTLNTITRLKEWQHQEAISEAQATGNDWNYTLLNGINPKRMSQSDQDTVSTLLFGDTQVTAANRVSSGSAKPSEDAPAEKRHDAAERKRIDAMTPEELRTELMTDHLTGIKNRRAYNESEKLPVQVSIDADSLKWINDNMGHHEGGDQMLKIIAEALEFETGDAYHISGDEFVVQSYSEEEANEIMAAVQESLSKVILKATLKSGETITLKGIGVSYGTGQNLGAAEHGLGQDKQRREAEGLRAARGEQPPGTTRKGGIQHSEPDSQTGDHTSAEGAVSRDWIKPEVEALIRQKANAGQIGKSHSIDKLIALTKRLLAGEDIKPGKFKSFVSDFKNLPAVAEVAQRLHDQIKEADKQAKAAEKLNALGADETTNGEPDQSADLNRQTEPEAGNKGFVKLGDNPDGSEIWGNAAGTRQRRNDGVVTGEMMRAGGEDQAPSNGRYQTKEESDSLAQAIAEAISDTQPTSVEDTPEIKQLKVSREVQRTIFKDASNHDMLIGAVAEGQQYFNEVARGYVDDTLNRMRAEGDLGGVTADNLPDEFWKALFRNAKRIAELAEKEKNRDPAVYQEALKSASVESSIALDDPAMVADFKEGFDHALKGKSKSTLTTGNVAAKLDGYERAWNWIKTAEGKAWYEGKRGTKLKDTGADLRRWFDKARQSLDNLDDSDPVKVFALLGKLTERAKVFDLRLEDATPGAQAWGAKLRSSILTFNEWVTKRGGLKDLYGNWSKKESEKILSFLKGSSYIYFGSGDTRTNTDGWDSTQRSKYLLDEAKKWIALIEPVVNALAGSKDIAELAGRFEDYAYEEIEGGRTQMIEAGRELNYKLLNSTSMDNFTSDSRFTRALKETEEAERTANRSTPLTRPKLDHVTRTGLPDYRGGKDVTPQQMKDTFGFADIGFGGYVAAKKDQDHLNYGYDAFMDLSKLLGINPKYMGFGGRLYFTIGALGHGKASAHFAYGQPHPDGGTVEAINLTNTKGDGTVAHEWFHALDFYLGNGAMTSDAGVRNLVGALKHFYDIAYLNGVPGKFLEGGWRYKLGKNATKLEQARYAITNGSYGHPVKTQYKKNADELGEDYWGNDKELLARAAEAWVFDKLGDNTNSYLVNDWVADGKVTAGSGFRGTPYPEGDERTRFSAHIEAFVQAIDWTEAGPKMNHDRLRASVKDERKEYEQAKQDLIAQLPQLATDITTRKHQAAKEVERLKMLESIEQNKARLLEEQKKRELIRQAEAEAALANAEKPADVVTEGNLSDDELNAIFDDADNEMEEAAAEKPNEPAPGSAAITAKADPESLPDDMAKAGYYVEERANGQGHIFSVIDQDGNTTSKAGTLAKAVADAVAFYRAENNSTAKPEKSAGALVSDASRLGAEMLSEAFKGLGDIFGGGRIQSFPAGFDAEAYAKARPHFAKALKAAELLGMTLKELFKLMIKTWGSGIRPYAIQFAKDENLGLQLNQTDSKGDSHVDHGTGGESPEALEGMATPAGERPEGGGDLRGNAEDGSGERAERDSITDQPGVPGLVSDGDSAEALHPTGSGTRGGTGGLGKGRTRPARSGVSGESTESGLDHPSNAAIPSIPAINFRITEDVRLGKGGEVEKFNDNLAAIRTLKLIEEEQRRATTEEQRTLARYVGWGGLANAFADDAGNFKDKWTARGPELAALLTPAEMSAARRSTRNAHYTSETIVKGMWDGAARLGFTGGLALESSLGPGNFIGLMPESMLGNTRFIGVENDSLTARIAQALYPQSTVLHSGFQKVPLADGAFDLAIGNPPFGAESLRFQFKPELRGVSIHNQFFRASMDALKPGGLQIMVVSRYLMDAKDDASRKALATQATLLGAIRLPDTAFKENARTEVVTDILFLQRRTAADEENMRQAFNLSASKIPKNERPEDKRARLALEAMIPDWVRTVNVPDPLGGLPIEVNAYFAQNMNMMLGSLERSGSMRFDNDITLRAHDGIDIGYALADAISRLPQNVHSRSEDAIKSSLERFKSLSESLEISLEGHEAGAIHLDTDGNLNQIIERETPEGETELSTRPLTKHSPWSNQLFMGADGKWFRPIVKLDEKGKPVKATKTDVAGNLITTKNNLYTREVFDSVADIPDSLRLGEEKHRRLIEMVKLRDALKKQLVLEAADAESEVMEHNRKKLAKMYHAFVVANEHISNPKNAALVSEMPDGALILSLEYKYKPAISAEKARKTGDKQRSASVTPADILRQRVVQKYEPPTQASSPSDALAISLSESGRVDMQRVADLLGMDEAGVEQALYGDMEDPLIFNDPETGVWETRNAYLSGNVRRKMEAARSAGLSKNAAVLEKVQPEAWGAENVTIKLGSSIVPTEILEDFVIHLVGGEARVRFSKIANSYEVTGETKGARATDTWGLSSMGAVAILSKILNSQPVKVVYTDMDGKTHVDKESTAVAQMKAAAIVNEFADWVFADTGRRQRLVDLFNEKYNTRAARQHDGSHLTLPGKVPDSVIKLARHQKNVVWRGIVERFLLIDHAVGAGKTFAAIARAMERRRMGLSRKPAIVVPNHMVAQFTADVYRLYPAAKVLAIGKNDMEKSKRRKAFAKIATGDWDIVIIPHSSFGMVTISPETEVRYLEHELELAKQAVEDAWEQAREDGTDSGRGKPFNVKEATRIEDKIQERLDGLRKAKVDKLLTFEQLGIDDMTIDEAHEFKNLYYNSKLTGVRGMGNKVGSKKAFDIYNKVRVLRESPTGSVAFMTGTPISNSAVEMYTLMRFLATDELHDLGLEHFDAWRAQFVDIATKYEPNEAGQLKEVNRLGRTWSNMRNLMDLYYSFTDAVSNEDIKKWYAEDNPGKEFPLPKVKWDERQSVVIKPTEAQQALLTEVLAGFDGLEGIQDPFERNKARLRLMDRARKVSLDARAVDFNNPSKEVGGKLDRVADEVTRIYKDWNTDKGTQLIFLDRSVPKSRGDDAILREFDKLKAEQDAALAKGDEDTFRRAEDKLEKFDENEIAELRNAKSGGWNAYAQIKENLIARGIPANEIRFIQDANNDAQKQAMFDAVNAGEVRVLVGSTQRMGAGTNVQERLVGLHHVDVTWKPSDIEQREGRIIRQGNSLLEKYVEKFAVEILAYATERTVDAKMWDLNATKLKTINDIRKYDGAFLMELEDADSVSMAEMAALASGDPLLLERVQLMSEIERIELLERAHRRREYGIQDGIKAAERNIDTLPKKIADKQKSIATVTKAINASVLEQSKRSVMVEGKTYSNDFDAKTAAKEAIDIQRAGDEKAKFSLSVDGKRITAMDMLDDVIRNKLGDSKPFSMEIEGMHLIRRADAAHEIANRAGVMAATLNKGDNASAKLGSFMGLTLELDVALSDKGGFDLALSLTSEDGATIDSTQTQDSAKKPEWTSATMRGVMTRMESHAENLAADGTYYLERTLAEAEKELPELKARAGQPFPRLAELNEKRDKLEKVTLELAGKGTKVHTDAESAQETPVRFIRFGNSVKPIYKFNDVSFDALPGEPFFTYQDNNGEDALTHAGTGLKLASGATPDGAYQTAKNIIDERGAAAIMGVINSKAPITDEEKAGAGRGSEAAPKFSRGNSEASSNESLSNDQTDAKILNDALAENYHDEQWRNAYAQVEVRNDDAGAVAAFERAFGRRVVAVAPTDGGTGSFAGIRLPQNPDVLYVTSPAKNIIAIAGHELYHDLAARHPDLHAWFVEQAIPYIKDFPKYKERLNRNIPDGEKHDDGSTSEELLADFTGDALSDPEFLKRLAGDNPSKFTELLNAVKRWLNKIVSKFYGNGSSEFVTNIKALRDHLANVLQVYASGGDIAAEVAETSKTSQTESAAFKKWFGDSKVVDADGNPMMVYHGSPFGPIEQFDTGQLMNESGAFFFTASKKVAENFASGKYVEWEEGRSSRPHVSEAYLALKNPAVFAGDVNDNLTIDNLFERMGLSASDIPADLSDLQGQIEEPAWVWYTNNSSMFDRLRELGFDGFVATEQGAQVYGVFNQTQIKSAIGNNGDFDPTNPSIKFSRDSLQSNHEVPTPSGQSRATPIDGPALAELRRAAAGLEAPERGITFTVNSDGQAIVTGPARTKVPARFQRFADEHGLTLIVHRRESGDFGKTHVDPMANTVVLGDKSYYGEVMPMDYREAGALYFGELREGHEDRTGKMRFRRVDPSADFNTADFRNNLRQKIADMFSTKRTFNSWWHKSVGTQYHKAEVDPVHFGPVFNMAQRFIDDLAQYANTASDKAPGLLPKLEKMRDTVTGLLHIKQDAKDAKAISEPIFQGTLNDKIYTDSELTTRFGLTTKQVGLYHEFRAAVDQSLDDLAISEMGRLSKMEGLERAPNNLSLHEATKFYQAQFESELEKAQDAMAELKERQRTERKLLEQAADDEASSADQRKRYAELLIGMHSRQATEMEKAKTLLDNFVQLQQGITDKYQKIEQLKQNGYAPLTRFGDYTVDVFLAGEDGKPIKDASGEEIRHFFGMFESEAEANKVARIMQEEYPDATVNQGVLSKEASQLFKGVTPETVELFAQMAGQEQSDAFQKYLKMAVNNRSAMKRLIKRSGVAGFSEDPTRVLASFLTSNARAAASNDYLGDMLRAAAAIPKEKGDVKDEAVKLLQYIQNPGEEASSLRGLLFINYLGGSVASALVNMTQPILMTFPYLHQFSGNAGSHLAWAMKLSSKKLFGKDIKLDDPGLMVAMKRAEEEGITSPHEIHMLYGESSRAGAFQHTRWFRNITKVWGSFFSLAESFNRHATFMAAFKIAEEKGMNADDAYEFSKKAVYDTQGIYSRANRPDWARGAVGATLFTFKQFSISYLEFLKRLPAKERALALAILMLAAGAQGMPGADDLDDLIDTIAESLGFSLNSKQAKRDFVAKLLGKEAAGYVMYGVSHGLPLDIAGRMSTGNLLPGTGILKKSEPDKTRDVTEFFGAAGGFATNLLHGLEKLQSGEYDKIAKEIAPKAIQDVMKAYDMAVTGEAHDQKGRMVAKVTPLDAAIRAIGFNPTSLAEGSRDRSILFQNTSLLKAVQSEIYEKWAQGIAEGDAGKTAAARQELQNWNRSNPDSPIRPKMSSIQKRVQEMKRSSDQRFIRSSPKQMKAHVAATLNAD